MHFKVSALLAGLVFTYFVDALPIPRAIPSPNPKPGLVTLPLKRLEQRSNVHPLIAHQQNINRSHRRFARMTGRSEPTSEELRSNLHKRVLAVSGEEGLVKRYNRVGVVKGKSKSRLAAGSGAVLASASATERHGHSHKGKGRHEGNEDDATGSGAATGTTGAAGGVTPANQPTANNSLGLDIEADDFGYLATVQIGTPPRNFLILMDSGSADLWVGAENCQAQAGGDCGNHTFLGPQSSSSFQDTNTPFKVTYGTGEVQGSIVQDDIVVAGLALKAHTFGVATTESVQFSDDSTPFDGLMGLAQSTLSEQRTLTPIEALAKAGLVQDAITSYKISRLADNKNDGEITFGGLDDTKFDSQTLVTLDNVSTQGFWEGALDAVSVDGTDVGLQGRTAILDTGTTLIVAPPADAAAVHNNIQGARSDGQGGFIVPCAFNSSIALTFGGTAFAIDPRDIAFQPVDPNNPTGDCISGISSGSVGGATEWLVGDVFLKNAYFSTDVTKNTISLATLV
ncbi:hypothetical protein DXG03_005838 [Asterophora parasitica]|uniref:Peptidase A1 domain-containing protein n=1 Tax=Asterophora parasitica TaxID=117018 RepID=A0A9P7GE75_9AGAR|nr:hypothetical protein DXG03_005838 [Asterophora parasitica]